MDALVRIFDLAVRQPWRRIGYLVSANRTGAMMTRISSQMTRFYKYVFPVLWFGFLAAFLTIPIATGAIAKAPFLLLAPLIMAIFGFFIFKRLIWNLADLVQDGGDFLMVKYRGYEAVSYTHLR